MEENKDGSRTNGSGRSSMLGLKPGNKLNIEMSIIGKTEASKGDIEEETSDYLSSPDLDKNTMNLGPKDRGNQRMDQEMERNRSSSSSSNFFIRKSSQLRRNQNWNCDLGHKRDHHSRSQQ